MLSVQWLLPPSVLQNGVTTFTVTWLHTRIYTGSCMFPQVLRVKMQPIPLVQSYFRNKTWKSFLSRKSYVISARPFTHCKAGRDEAGHGEDPWQGHAKLFIVIASQFLFTCLLYLLRKCGQRVLNSPLVTGAWEKVSRLCVKNFSATFRSLKS